MGQKVNPKIFRIGTVNTWSSKWFTKKDYRTLLKEDILIRKFIFYKLKEASVDKIEIERFPGSINITIHSAKPGLIIGRAGVGIEELKNEIQKKFLDKKTNLKLNVQEITQPNLSAAVVLQSIIVDLEKRIPYRRIIKQTINRVEKSGAQGVKITIAGRLNGVEIARTETISSGKIPLHTLRADIDYSRGFARTIYGTLGVKVWIYRGDIFTKKTERVSEKK